MDIKEELAQLRNENRMLREQVTALRKQNELMKQRLEEIARKGEPVPAFVKANKPK
jgi:cell division protein FtsB